MKLEEKHKEFVVKCFARFMTLTQIVDAFMEEFEDDLPPTDLSGLPTIEELIEEDHGEKESEIKLEFIDDFIEEHREIFEEKYGDKADEMLKEQALEDYDFEYLQDYTNARDKLRNQILTTHKELLRENLFNRFRRLDINHGQFPDKYKALFKDTRDEFGKNYRIPDLSVMENVVRELEILYGYEKQHILQQSNSKDVTKHMNLAHQILKTIIACNAIDAKPEVVDVTPQDVKKALKKAQKSTTD
ncbi:hypothetical protein C6500_20775 [Candidatus Poribacteria bacterium]|nr:MAG: hypothetical protein C6500_20775 [Candidatus Poribacteria bacterium]